jgi:hypothetical protein
MASLLFGNTLPTSTTGALTTTNDALPDWYQAYTRGIAAKADAVANQPYQAYTQPRIEGFNDVQLGAQQDILGNAGAWRPSLDAAEAGLTGGLNTYGNAANTGFNKAAGADFATDINTYMSPYTTGVVDELARLGNRNLFDNVLPGVNSTFAGTGQFGSTRNADFTNRAITQNQGEILGAQSKALESGFQNAATNWQNDKNSNIQLGQSAGSLLNQGSTALGALGQQRTTLGLTDANANQVVGQQQQALDQQGLDLQYQDFLQQRDYPQSQLSYLNSMIRGLPVDKTQFQTKSDLNSQTLGNMGSASGLSQILQGISGVAGVKSALGIK